MTGVPLRSFGCFPKLPCVPRPWCGVRSRVAIENGCPRQSIKKKKKKKKKISYLVTRTRRRRSELGCVALASPARCLLSTIADF